MCYSVVRCSFTRKFIFDTFRRGFRCLTGCVLTNHLDVNCLMFLDKLSLKWNVRYSFLKMIQDNFEHLNCIKTNYKKFSKLYFKEKTNIQIFPLSYSRSHFCTFKKNLRIIKKKLNLFHSTFLNFTKMLWKFYEKTNLFVLRLERTVQNFQVIPWVILEASNHSVTLPSGPRIMNYICFTKLLWFHRRKEKNVFPY